MRDDRKIEERRRIAGIMTIYCRSGSVVLYLLFPFLALSPIFESRDERMWIALALGSAFLTAVVGTLTKAGTERVDPTVALAVQALVLALCAWGFLALRGKLGEVGEIPAKSWPILLLAGAATFVAYVMYFRALSSGSSSAVQPLDRLSLIFAVILAGAFLREKVTPAMIVGVVLMAIGAIVIAVGSPASPQGEVRATRTENVG